MTKVVGDVHVHGLPSALSIRLGSIVACECGDRFLAVPKGMIGAGWAPAGELKTEEEVKTPGETDNGTTNTTESSTTESVQTDK